MVLGVTSFQFCVMSWTTSSWTYCCTCVVYQVYTSDWGGTPQWYTSWYTTTPGTVVLSTPGTVSSNYDEFQIQSFELVLILDGADSVTVVLNPINIIDKTTQNYYPRNSWRNRPGQQPESSLSWTLKNSEVTPVSRINGQCSVKNVFNTAYKIYY